MELRLTKRRAKRDVTLLRGIGFFYLLWSLWLLTLSVRSATLLSTITLACATVVLVSQAVFFFLAARSLRDGGKEVRLGALANISLATLTGLSMLVIVAVMLLILLYVCLALAMRYELHLIYGDGLLFIIFVVFLTVIAYTGEYIARLASNLVLGFDNEFAWIRAKLPRRRFFRAFVYFLAAGAYAYTNFTRFRGTLPTEVFKAVMDVSLESLLSFMAIDSAINALSDRK